MADKCKRCGACKECGAVANPAPVIYVYPYQPYQYVSYPQPMKFYSGYSSSGNWNSASGSAQTGINYISTTASAT